MRPDRCPALARRAENRLPSAGDMASRDQAGERSGVSLRVGHAAEARLESPDTAVAVPTAKTGRSCSDGGHAAMAFRLVSRVAATRGQGTNLPGDDRQDGCDDGKKAKRGQAGGGLGGAGLWSRDQNALQKAALVKEPPVDDVWREAERVVILTSGRVATKTQGQVAVCLGQDIGLERYDETGSGDRDVLR